MTRPFRILLVGVGGQGVLTCATILGDAAVAADIPVTLGQLHTMSQRGGGTESTVVIGPAHTAFVGQGEADLVLGFEPLETLRALPRMSSRTQVIMNRDRITPFSMTWADENYPSLESIEASIRGLGAGLEILDAVLVSRQAGDQRALGSAMLGVAARLGVLPFDERSIRDAIAGNCPSAALPANRRAFTLGMDKLAAETA